MKQYTANGFFSSNLRLRQKKTPFFLLSKRHVPRRGHSEHFKHEQSIAWSSVYISFKRSNVRILTLRCPAKRLQLTRRPSREYIRLNITNRRNDSEKKYEFPTFVIVLMLYSTRSFEKVLLFYFQYKPLYFIYVLNCCEVLYYVISDEYYILSYTVLYTNDMLFRYNLKLYIYI